jgi:hypothetical protein
LILPWSHQRAKLWRTFRFQVDGIKDKVRDYRNGGDSEYEIECHS